MEGDRLVAVLPELYALCPQDAFPARLLALAHRLIPCDDASFNEIDLRSGAFRVLIDPPERVDDPATPAFDAYVHQHPVIAHVASTGDQSPHTISEFLRPTELRRLELYGEFLSQLGIEDQLSVTLTVATGKTVVGLGLNRAGTFTTDECDLLAALRPHLVTAYRNAVAYSDALAGVGEERAAVASERLACLTGRQFQVLSLVAQGRTNAQVAMELGCSTATVKKHVEHLLARLGAETRIAAARIWLDGSPRSDVSSWWILDGEADEPLAG